MIEAAQAAILDAAEGEIGATVRAMAAEQADLAGLVAEQHQILAHDADRHRRAAFGQLDAAGDGLPIAPQQLAAGGARPGLGEAPILFCRGHLFRLPTKRKFGRKARKSMVFRAGYRSGGKLPIVFDKQGGSRDEQRSG